MTLENDLDKLLHIAGIAKKQSRFSNGDAYFLGKLEIAHVHNSHEIDIRLTRKAIGSLKETVESDSRYNWRSPRSDWLEFCFEQTQNVDEAMRLIHLAIENNER